MNILIGEVIGTAFMILLGDGVVANVLLTKTKGHNSGWLVITTAWALAVFVGAYTSVAVGGDAHLNPAITLGFAISGQVAWAKLPLYAGGQFLGAVLGATLVWLAYLPHWAPTEDQNAKLGVFCTAPAIRHTAANLISEVIGTFALMLGVFLIHAVAVETDGASTAVDLGALGALPVALLVWVVGLSLGGPTGYAINPVRDFGPRVAHAMLPIAGKGGSDWGYAWIPIAGPVIGAALAALVFGLLPTVERF